MIFELSKLLTVFAQMTSTVEIHIFSLLIFLDILSGLVKGFVNKKANSTKGLLGIVKHFLIVLLVYTFYPYLVLLGAKVIATAFVLFFIGAYGISVVENYGQLGLPMPTFLKNYFEKLKRLGDQGKPIQLNLDPERIASGIRQSADVAVDLEAGTVEFKQQEQSDEEEENGNSN